MKKQHRYAVESANRTGKASGGFEQLAREIVARAVALNLILLSGDIVQQVLIAEVAVCILEIESLCWKQKTSNNAYANAIWDLSKIIALAPTVKNKIAEIAITLARKLIGKTLVRNYARTIINLTSIGGNDAMEVAPRIRIVDTVIDLAGPIFPLSKRSSPLSERDCATIVHGLAKMIDAETTSRMIPTQRARIADIMLDLAEQILLPATHPNAQDCSSTIWGIGKLIEAGVIDKGRRRMRATIITLALTERLRGLIPTEQGCAITIWGLGKALEEVILEQVQKTRATEVVIDLAARLLQPAMHPTAQNCANIIWGLGKMMEEGIIDQVHKARVADIAIALAWRLLQSGVHSNAQCCANIVWGLIKALEGVILDQIQKIRVTEIIIALTKQLLQSNPRPTEQNCVNVLWGLSEIAENGITDQRQITQVADISIDIAKCLLQPSLHLYARQYANAIWRLGRLVEAEIIGQTQIIKAADVAINLAERLLQPDLQPNAQDCTHTIWGLSKIAAAGEINLTQRMRVSNVVITLSGLLQKIHLEVIHPNAQDCANAIWGLGKMVEAGIIDQAQMMQVVGIAFDLAGQLQSDADANAQDCANAIWGLGKLQRMSRQPTPGAIKEVIAKLQKACLENENNNVNKSKRYTQVAQGLAMLEMEIPENVVAFLEQNKPQSSDSHKQISGILSVQGWLHEDEKLLVGYFVDMYFPAHKLIIEIDGEHHKIEHQKMADKQRDELLRSKGYEVVRFALGLQQRLVDSIVKVLRQTAAQAKTPALAECAEKVCKMPIQQVTMRGSVSIADSSDGAQVGEIRQHQRRHNRHNKRKKTPAPVGASKAPVAKPIVPNTTTLTPQKSASFATIMDKFGIYGASKKIADAVWNIACAIL